MAKKTNNFVGLKITSLDGKVMKAASLAAAKYLRNLPFGLEEADDYMLDLFVRLALIENHMQVYKALGGDPVFYAYCLPDEPETMQ